MLAKMPENKHPFDGVSELRSGLFIHRPMRKLIMGYNVLRQIEGQVNPTCSLLGKRESRTKLALRSNSETVA